MNPNPEPEKTSRLDAPLKRWIPANYETLLVVLILIAAVVSRFYDLGARAMSHDEINHVIPTYSLYTGRGYVLDPMSHGPLQYHLIALSYALFGDNDFTTRIPVALFGVATVAVGLLLFRRYLGRAGAIVAGILLLISPYLLFYERYARNEAFIVLWAMLLIYSVLRYLERGETWTLFLFAIANAFHFTDKATSYMFAGGIFIFLFFYFVDHVSRRPWTLPRWRLNFLLGVALALILVLSAVTVYVATKPEVSEAAATVVADETAVQTETENARPAWVLDLAAVLGVAGLGAAVWAGVAAVKGLGWAGLRSERPLALLILLGTLVLPLLSAIPIQWLGYMPQDYTTDGNIRIAIAVLVLGGIGAALGIWWLGKRWLFLAAVFFLPIIVLYTTFFTEPQMIGSSFVGLFSYWLGQHGEGRGSQPLFYYALVQVPIYEFLPALGMLVTGLVATFGRLWRSAPGQPFKTASETEDDQQPVPIAALTVFWSLFCLGIFSYAGERMPWLTTHITLPMILATAWVTGWLIETRPWKRLGAWDWRQYTRAIMLGLFALLALVTARSAYRAAYINYDYPLEYMVYAHGAPDPKALYEQIEEISYRTTGTTDIVVAYDNDVRYPYWWYLRRYPNKIDFDTNPSRDLSRALIIAANSAKVGQLAPVTQFNFVEMDGMRLWWQNQDYWSLKWDSIKYEYRAAMAPEYSETGQEVPEMTLGDYLEYAWPHIKPVFTDRAVQSAVWQIWFNRDFTEWGALRGNDTYTLTNWGVSDRMKIYIRKDMAAQLWPYGAEAQVLPEPVDPYASITLPASQDLILGLPGSEIGYFQSPRQIAFAPDGTLYIADSLNHRIQHITQDGGILHVWGQYANALAGEAAPGGTFNEPWGVAVGPDGSVYVADTWNFRIQKFTPDGQFLTMWSTYDAGGFETTFYGPRGLAVDPQGRVYVADTGNKVIVIFDSDGNYITQIGSPGMGLGQLDEPVALALDDFGNVYVTDTWNQRLQVFVPDQSGLYYTPLAEWPVNGWFGQSLENKPFVAVGLNGSVFVTDPEMCRVIEFSPVGDPLHVWDGCVTGAFQFPSGIVSDGTGGLWVSDAANGALTHFIPAVP
ncbi:MAG: glycosyltransferase family 39 protein [Chloroflexota bacterium]